MNWGDWGELRGERGEILGLFIAPTMMVSVEIGKDFAIDKVGRRSACPRSLGACKYAAAFCS